MFDNKREWKIHEMYLNAERADVNFVFDADTDHPVKMPAHKIILSLDSPVFDAMFFGSFAEQGDVPIVGVPVAAFTEFLQFFYLEEVRLSIENIAYVMDLCKTYETDEFLESCEIVFRDSITLDGMCWGYGIAQLLQQKRLSKFCGEKIKANATAIMKSESFLDCDSEFLSKILALVSSDWSVLERVFACMAWSKAECNRKNLEANPLNLRDQLKDVFNQIPFDELTTQQLSKHAATYSGFFTADELETLFIETLSPRRFSLSDLHPLKDRPNLPSGRILLCDRQLDEVFKGKQPNNSITIFSSNKTLLFTKFVIQFKCGVGFKYFIAESNTPSPISVFSVKSILVGDHRNNHVTLPKPIVINAGKFYRIVISKDKTTCNNADHELVSKKLVDLVHLENDIKIRFNYQRKDLLSHLIFQAP